jgi:hypothetical protein
MPVTYGHNERYGLILNAADSPNTLRINGLVNFCNTESFQFLPSLMVHQPVLELIICGKTTQ